MEIIQRHFFNRGKLLRCYRIAGELRSILNDIERNRLYELRKEVRSRREFEEFIESHPKTLNDREIPDKLLAFIKTYMKTDQEAKELTQLIENKYISEVESLQLKLQQTDENFHALQLIEQNGSIFSDEERSELYSLFGMYGNTNENIDADTCGRRQQYWNLELNLTRSQNRRKVAQYAISAYGSM
jgi:hypothetical protein